RTARAPRRRPSQPLPRLARVVDARLRSTVERPDRDRHRRRGRRARRATGLPDCAGGVACPPSCLGPGRIAGGTAAGAVHGAPRAVGHRRGTRVAVSLPTPRFVGLRRRVLEVGIAGLAGFTVAAFVIPAGPLAADAEWSEWMLGIQTSLLTNVALVFNSLG